MTTTHKKADRAKPRKRTVHLTKVQKAILLLANYMEDPMHHDYRVQNHVLDILGLELVPTKSKRTKS